MVVNGGYRTGSTVVYNIVRCILEQLGVEFHGGLRSHPAEIDRELDVHATEPAWYLVKSHVWAPSTARPWPALRILYTYRDLLDVAASLQRHREQWSDILVEIQRQALLTNYHRHAEIQRIHSPLLLRYEQYYYDPRARIRDVAQHLGIELSDAQVEEVHATVDIPQVLEIQRSLAAGTQDDRTLVQGDHIGERMGEPVAIHGMMTSAAGTLTAARVASILAALSVLGLDRYSLEDAQ